MIDFNIMSIFSWFI